MRSAKIGKLGVVILIGLTKRSIEGATCWAVIGGRFGLLKSHPCLFVLRMVWVALDRIPGL
jgi:hypothetical protein